MAADFGKILGKIEDENTALREAQARLQKAYVKLDGKLTRLKAKARIEPYVVDKKTGLQIGYRRIEAQYCITTIRVGLGGTEAEIPVSEASPEAIWLGDAAATLRREMLANDLDPICKRCVAMGRARERMDT